MPPKTRSTPRRGKAVSAAATTPPTADRGGSPRSSPAGGISKLPSGRYRARVDGDTVGTFDTLEEAAAAMTQATMRKLDARSTPVSTPVSTPRRAPPPARVTPEQAARRSLPDPEEADADPPASAPQTGTLPPPSLARHLLLALLALLLAALAATRPGLSPASSAPTSAAPAPGCASAASFETLAELAPPAWGETMETFLDAAREANANPDATDHSSRFVGARKGVALALIAADAAEARRRADDALDAFPECRRERCALRLDADELVAAAAKPTRTRDGEIRDGRAAELEARGEAQRRLATFLADCPGGAVVVSGAEALTPPLLSAILPAVSEGGRFMRDGGEVRADRAAYVFVAAAGAEAGEGGAWRELDDAGFARRAKDALAAGWGSEEDGVVRAFRRRIDFVAPLR